MARQKAAEANAEQMVENTVVAIEAQAPAKEKRIVVTKDMPLYKIATQQRNMIVGTLVAGHSYPYKGKTRNAEGIFYSIGKGFVHAEDCVKIQ